MQANHSSAPGEGLKITLLLAVYALLSFLSLRWFPVFVDEPGYTDPAASLFLGQGFTSGAWYAQGYEGFWAGNVPLHQACLYLWMKAFGFSQVSVRSINILFVMLGMLLLWVGVRKLNILQTPAARMATVALVLCSHAGAIWVNIGRPDAICLALAGILVFAFSLERKAWRLALASFVGLAAPWAGIPLVLVIGFAGMSLLVLFRKRFASEVICLATGGFIGMASLLAMYQSQGVLQAFLQSLLPHSSLFGKSSGIIPPPVNGLKHRLGALLDYTLLSLIAATGVAWLASWRIRTARPWLLLGGLALGGVPLVLAGAGVFPIYYAWYAFIPGLVALMALWERDLIRGGLWKACVALALAGVVLLGFPRVLLMGFLYRADDVNGKSESFLSSVLRPDDVVLCQSQAWYGAKQHTNRVYHGFRAPNLTPDEAASINVAVCSPKFFYAQREILTGEWTETRERLAVPNRNTHRLPFSKWYRDNPTLDLHIYRRASH